MKTDSVIKRETKYIACCTAVLSFFMHCVFYFGGKWHYSLLLGNIIGAAVAVLNFYFMGQTLQKAVNVDKKTAQNRIKLSWLLRNILLFFTVVAGLTVPHLSATSVILPLFFPRIAVFFRPFLQKKINES